MYIYIHPCNHCTLSVMQLSLLPPSSSFSLLPLYQYMHLKLVANFRLFFFLSPPYNSDTRSHRERERETHTHKMPRSGERRESIDGESTKNVREDKLFSSLARHTQFCFAVFFFVCSAQSEHNFIYKKSIALFRTEG